MNVEGTIKAIFETAQVSEKFSKREFVITTQGDYPQDILIQLTQDKCSLLDAYHNGQLVNVSINLRGREWVSPKGEKKYFNTVEGWKIEPMNGSIKVAEKVQENAPIQAKDDLPF